MELWKDRAHEASLPQSITSSYSTRKLAPSTISTTDRHNTQGVDRVNEFNREDEIDADDNSEEDSDVNRRQGRLINVHGSHEVNQRGDAITRRLLQRQLV